jgi:hypothetical protein
MADVAADRFFQGPQLLAGLFADEEPVMHERILTKRLRLASGLFLADQDQSGNAAATTARESIPKSIPAPKIRAI